MVGDKNHLIRIITGAIRSARDAHPEMTDAELSTSIAKRISGEVLAPAPAAPLGAVEVNLPHYSDPISDRIKTEALERAAQAWCDKSTEHLAMIPELAEAFAKRLAPLLNEIDKLAQFIMREIPGEPSQNQGAADTAIRLLSTLPAPPAPQGPTPKAFEDLVVHLEGEITSGHVTEIELTSELMDKIAEARRCLVLPSVQEPYQAAPADFIRVARLAFGVPEIHGSRCLCGRCDKYVLDAAPAREPAALDIREVVRACRFGRVEVHCKGGKYYAVCSCGFQGPPAELFRAAVDGVWVKGHPLLTSASESVSNANRPDPSPSPSPVVPPVEPEERWRGTRFRCAGKDKAKTRGDQICDECGGRFGEHSALSDRCPTYPETPAPKEGNPHG